MRANQLVQLGREIGRRFSDLGVEVGVETLRLLYPLI